MSQSFFKLDKAWYDDELWVIPGDYQNIVFCDSEILKIYDGGNYIIAAVCNDQFYLHGLNPICFPGFLCIQIYGVL